MVVNEQEAKVIVQLISNSIAHGDVRSESDFTYLIDFKKRIVEEFTKKPEVTSVK